MRDEDLLLSERLTPEQKRLLEEIVPPKPVDSLMTTADVAAALAVSTDSVVNWMLAGAFGEYVVLGTSKQPRYRIWRSGYERFVEERTRIA
jgi:hypothetical protein